VPERDRPFIDWFVAAVSPNGWRLTLIEEMSRSHFDKGAKSLANLSRKVKGTGLGRTHRAGASGGECFFGRDRGKFQIETRRRSGGSIWLVPREALGPMNSDAGRPANEPNPFRGKPTNSELELWKATTSRRDNPMDLSDDELCKEQKQVFDRATRHAPKTKRQWTPELVAALRRTIEKAKRREARRNAKPSEN